MSKNNLVMPVLKWVGGKKQLLKTLLPLCKKFTTYCEPFVGGGALLFKLQPTKAYVNDINADLIHVYEVIRDDVKALIEALETHKNESDHFYTVRNWDRDPKTYATRSKIEKAARIIYLNKTCYNGLFRVNNAGEFNSPFGNYRNPNIVNEYVLLAVSKYFNKAKIEFSIGDYAPILEKLPKDAFVYLDPPYDPVSDTANFTGYSRGGFDRNEQIRLKKYCDTLGERGINFMLSSSATDFIRDLYANYNIKTVKAKRAINSNPHKRGDVDELIIRNYDR